MKTSVINWKGNRYITTITHFKHVPIQQEFFYFSRRWRKTDECHAIWIAKGTEYFIADDTKVAAIERSAI